MNKNNPLVCICVPNFNNEKTLAATLDSLIKQTYKNIIVRIFDNASTDSSLNIIKKYMNEHSNIELYKNEFTVTGEENFTRCIRHSCGKYTAIFHSDDIYHPDIITKQVQFLEKYASVAVATHALTINDSGKITGKRFLPYELRKKSEHIFTFIELFRLVLKYGNFITCPSVMSRTDILKNDIKIWDGENYKTSADLDVWFRLSEIGKFGLINEPLINYRISESSFSFNLKKVRINRHDIFLVLADYMSKYDDIIDFEYRYFLDILYFKDDLLINFNLLKFRDKCNNIKFTSCRKSNFFLSSFFHIRILFFGFFIILFCRIHNCFLNKGKLK
jgi:glycosyltransferase involved in cell wall biosynthesis